MIHMVFEGQPWGIVSLAWPYSVWKDPPISWSLPKSTPQLRHPTQTSSHPDGRLLIKVHLARTVASAKDGKYHEVASLHVPILKARATLGSIT